MCRNPTASFIHIDRPEANTYLEMAVYNRMGEESDYETAV